MTSDTDRLAARLVELEKEREAEQESRRQEQEEISRFADARRRIREHDREREQEQVRQAARVEADALAVQLGERANELQLQAEALRQSIEDYIGLRTRLQHAQRRSHQGVGGNRNSSDRYILPNWFKSVFGGHGSLIGVESEMAGRAIAVGHGPRALAERDPLASTRTNPGTEEAS